MKKVNYPLIIGAIIVILLIVIVIFESKIAEIDPYALNIGEMKEIDGKVTYIKPPFPPNDIYKLGTDILGRDIFSRLIYGAKITLKLALIATLFRFIVAIPMAFFSGFGNKATSTAIRYFSTIFSSIPALIVSIIILNIPNIKWAKIDKAIIIFAIVLTFVEWGRLAKTLEGSVKDILSMNFINGEVAIGKSKLQIAIQNVVPHMISPIIIHFFMEMSRSLVLVAQLGVFGVYVGPNKLDIHMIRDLNLGITPSYYPEWGGMLATSRYAITIKQPWIIMYPVGAFFLSVFGFNMLGEGLKIEVNKRDSMALTHIKRLLNHLNPLTYIYELKNIKKYKKSVSVKTIILLIIISIVLIPAPESSFKLDSKEVFAHVQEFDKDEYSGRLVSSEGSKNAASYIINKLENSKLTPLFDNKYIDEFEIKSDLADIKSSRMYIKNNDGSEQIQFKFRKDYEFKDKILSKEEISGTIITLSEFEKDNYDKEKKYLVIIDEEMNYLDAFSYGDNYNKLIEIGKLKNVEGIIFPVIEYDNFYRKVLYNIEDYDKYNENKEKFYFDNFIIFIEEEIKEDIIKNVGKEITIENKFSPIEGNGTNIGGMIPSKEETDETILVVTNYDYLGYQGNTKYKGLLYNSTSISTSLEMINELSNSEEKPNKNIVFLFLDSSKIDMQGAKRFIQSYSSVISENSFIIGMNYLGLKESDILYMDNTSISSDNQELQEYSNYIKERANESKITLELASLADEEDDLVELIKRSKGSGIIFKSIGIGKMIQHNKTKQDDITLIDENNLKEQGQLILDFIAHLAY